MTLVEAYPRHAASMDFPERADPRIDGELLPVSPVIRPRLSFPAAFVLLLFPLLVAACGPVPQPFAKAEPAFDRATDLIAPTTEGVSVLPVEGVNAETGRLIASMTAEALQKEGVAATDKASNRASLFLASTGQRQPDGALAITWTLVRPDGVVIGERTDAIASDDALAASLVSVANWILPYRSRADAAAHGRPAIAVYPVSGAPGDGNDLLYRAMGLALARGPVEVTADAVPGGYVVQADVNVTRLKDGRDRVAVSWAVMDARGRELGTVDQENAVPGGSLDHRWGAVAAPIADAAVDGVIALIRQSAASRDKVGLGRAERP